jgi:gamma-glutamyltranspeptidase/glutathione hydrolase
MAQDDQDVIPWLRKDPARVARFSFLWERYLDRGEVRIGTRIHVPEQARALRLIAQHGARGFYEGEVADAIVRAVQRDGGWLTRDDLRSYRVAERRPLTAEFGGLEVLTMPPPSSGGIVIAQLFDMLEARPDLLNAAREHNSPAYVHLITECFKHGFADRARWMGDPGFVDVPVSGLLAPARVNGRASMIDPDRTLPNASYGSAQRPPEDHGTSHLCVIDAQGNAVACTETINLIFGSLLCVPEYGFALNNEMDDFLTRRGEANAFGLAHAELNRPAPGKRPLSSMTPTIVWDPGTPGSHAAREGGSARLIVGGAGGPRIISGSAQVALNTLLFDMNAHEAVSAPRFHHQWQPDTLQLEAALASPPLEAALRAKGHEVGQRKSVGNITVIRTAKQGKGWDAASDPRKGGAPAGY